MTDWTGYVYVVYRVEPHYLDGFTADLERHEQEGKRLRVEAFERMRREAEEQGAVFDAGEALAEINRRDELRTSPWHLLVKIKEAFLSEDHAREEARRLNLTAAGDCAYYWQAAKFYPEGRKAQQKRDDHDPQPED